jgi:hypothetical protein
VPDVVASLKENTRLAARTSLATVVGAGSIAARAACESFFVKTFARWRRYLTHYVNPVNLALMEER